MPKKSHQVLPSGDEKSPFLSGESSYRDREKHREDDRHCSSDKGSAPSAVPIPTESETEHTPDQIPVTICTGYLGAGKTTVITNLMKQMPEDYAIAWLKNEMGNTDVDTQLARGTHTATVKEMLQGCICHVMIGQLSKALDEMLLSHPDRIIIETSGSATPAPVVWQIRNHKRLYADGVLTVVDAQNFKGYVNKSPSLKMQAKYTDLILINKHEDLSEAKLEQNLDDLYEINLDTPKIKTDRGMISPEIVFGLDSALFLTKDSVDEEESHADHHHHVHEVEILEIRPRDIFDPEKLRKAMEQLPKTDFYRIKGVLRDGDAACIMNCSFGECAIMRIPSMDGEQRMIFFGENLSNHRESLAEIFHLSPEDIIYTPKGHHHEHDHEHHEKHHHEEE